MGSNVTSVNKREIAGVRVTSLCMGCTGLGNTTDVSEEQSRATLHAFFNSPMNFLDTAAWYGDGESEGRIGIVLRELGGLPRDHVLSTKVDRNAQTGDFSGEQTKRSLERSLELLGMDHLQIVLLHDPEYSTWEHVTQRDGAVDVLRDYKEQGVIDRIGVGMGPIDLTLRYLDLGGFDVVLTHNRYTLLNRSAEKLFQYAIEHKVTILNAAVYGGGMLARGPENFPKYMYRDADPVTLERAIKMQALCNEYGVPLPAAAIQFSTRDPRITSTVIGMSRPERIQQTLDYANHPIPEELWGKLDAVGFETEDV